MFSIDYIEFFKNIPPQLATFLIAMLPIAELRVSIPLALSVYKMSIWSEFSLSVLGAFIPGIIIVYLFEPIAKFLMKHSKIFNKFFIWLFKKTRAHHAAKFEKYGLVAILIIAATPLPLAGVWTSSLAAILFNMPKRASLIMIFLGTMIAGLLVSLAYLGVLNAIKIF
ncbi:MAG: small multi-drug export protein [Candidatus Parcubacteria bacterium]|nr:small multi-drug export protein [Candidatus Parcubacteria bacterium]